MSSSAVTESSEAIDVSTAPPRCYLIQHNIGKKHNVGTLARCSTAFGVEEVTPVATAGCTAVLMTQSRCMPSPR